MPDYRYGRDNPGRDLPGIATTFCVHHVLGRKTHSVHFAFIAMLLNKD